MVGIWAGVQGAHNLHATAGNISGLELCWNEL
jgi:hypothetical protein